MQSCKVWLVPPILCQSRARKREISKLSNSLKKQILRFILLGIPLLCILTFAISTLSNIGLPVASSNPDLLSSSQKALIAEAYRLQQSLGSQVWPGFGEARIPIIVHNEGYAFLVNSDGQPSDGWRRIPEETPRGGAWLPVVGDDFYGEVYYRQPLDPQGSTPENFTVMVGEQWAATLFTREYSRIAIRSDFESQAPFPLNKVIPYRLVWKFLLGDSEVYIGGLIHEAFHAFQAETVYNRLDQAEESMHTDTRYPWDDPALAESWQQEMDVLVDALRSEDPTRVGSLACQFIQLRDQRREQFELSAEEISFEREREWLEGLAKYTELTVLRLAQGTGSEKLAPGADALEDFSAYAGMEDYYWQQVGEVRRLSGRSGDTRFYYTGFAQGALLDRLSPGWQKRAFDEAVYLEDLLRAACPAP